MGFEPKGDALAKDGLFVLSLVIGRNFDPRQIKRVSVRHIAIGVAATGERRRDAA
jgi:hypothetical protein